MATAGVIDDDVYSIGRFGAFGQRPVLPGVGILCGRLKRLADLVLCCHAAHVEFHTTGVGWFVRLYGHLDFLTHQHVRDGEAGQILTAAAQPQILWSGILA